jgi:hypothetical protein
MPNFILDFFDILKYVSTPRVHMHPQTEMDIPYDNSYIVKGYGVEIFG